MVGSARLCLHNSMRAVNLFVNVCGVGVIIYSLWLIKKWQVGVSELPPVAHVPKPWFIYTCLGMGIAVCLSTLCGHMVANSISSFILFIVSFLQFAKYIDEYHTLFKNFLTFHLNMCRLIVVLILIPQIKAIVLAIILWAIGSEPRADQCNYSDVTNFTYSFLAAPTQSLLDISRHGFRNHEVSSREFENPPRPSFVSNVNRFFRMHFHRRVTLILAQVKFEDCMSKQSLKAIMKPSGICKSKCPRPRLSPIQNSKSSTQIKCLGQKIVADIMAIEKITIKRKATFKSAVVLVSPRNNKNLHRRNPTNTCPKLISSAPPQPACSATLSAAFMESQAGGSVFSHVPQVPEVPLYAMQAAYGKDPSPQKLNLGIGVYRTEDGRPVLLDVVSRAERLLVNDLSSFKEYLPITGMPDFNRLSAALVLGADSPAIRDNRVTTAQCLSGSGSIRIGADFLAKHYGQHRIVYMSQQTYGNHPNFFSAAGIAIKTYRYYDPGTRGLDFQGMLEDLRSSPTGAIVLLQACAQNPTGVDPTMSQWEQIRQLMRSKGLLPFFDCAYQGFVSGNLEEDAQSIRLFVADGGESLIAQSYSKNMGLYGERVGALSIVCKTAEVASNVESQLKLVIRPMYSNPPIHGAAIVAAILKDRDMYNEWSNEVKAMADRLMSMRQHLFNALRTPGDWSHIIRQVGMFTFSGLSPEQVAFITKEYHIYLPSDGRINMAGLGPKTVPHLADAIHAAVTTAV
ncbi:hypothetical protein ACFX15_042606 [Malus domestica]